MELRDLTVTGFCTETISSSPAPGGGSVAALCGALAASLSGMVCELTIGKKGYEEQEAQMQAILAQAKSLQNELLLAIDEDSCSFNGFMAALKLPKNTEEEKTIRQAAMQEGLKAAAIVPMHTAELAAKIFPLARFAVERGNKNALAFIQSVREKGGAEAGALKPERYGTSAPARNVAGRGFDI